MKTPASTENTTVHSHTSVNYVGTDPAVRDRGQSHRLHEPGLMISTIDPITGRDIEDLAGRPYHVDGNMVMYFESEKTRQEYLDMPLDHPVPLPDNPDEDGEAEG
jgi:hypothetical protein